MGFLTNTKPSNLGSSYEIITFNDVMGSNRMIKGERVEDKEEGREAWITTSPLR